MNILLISHGHPAFSKGGAEICTERLFSAFNCHNDLNILWISAVTEHHWLGSGCELMQIGANQIGVKGAYDFLQTSPMNINFSSELGQKVIAFKPDIVHCHHYLFLGVDLFSAIAKWCPSAKFVLTLHDYWAMCPMEGRMLKANGQLCMQAKLQDCWQCMPMYPIGDHFLRERIIEQAFAGIDVFISPSHFLKTRYEEWGGCNSAPIYVLSNPNTNIESLPDYMHNGDLDLTHGDQFLEDTSSSSLDHGLIYGYFGQVNQWKGVDIIINAFLAFLNRQQDHNIECILQIHGMDEMNVLLDDNDSYHAHIAKLAAQKPEQIQIMGCYEQSDLYSRMQGVHAVVMASRWWENAPLVIDEAKLLDRWIIAPQIGGMAEKLAGYQRRYFYTDYGHAPTVAQLLTAFKKISTLIPQGLTALEVEQTKVNHMDAAEEHLSLYRKIMGNLN
ncbi:MAG: glycosyltransferase [Polynucleobacter sp.]